MGTDKAITDWAELKGKIKSKWSKLVEADLESFKGNMHLICEKVEKTYGITKDKAQQEFHDFKKSLEPALAPIAEKTTPK